MNFVEPRYTFQYYIKPFNVIFLGCLVFFIWIGSILELSEHGFSGNIFSKVSSSIAMIYVVWLWYASRKQMPIIFEPNQIHIPSRYFPGVLSHSVEWVNIESIEYRSRLTGGYTRENVLTIFLKSGRKVDIITSSLSIKQKPYLAVSAVDKLYSYINSVIGKPIGEPNQAFKRVP